MRTEARRVWLVVGGLLSAFLVGGIAFAVWYDIRMPRESAPTWMLSAESTEVTETVYRLTVPRIVLDLDGDARVTVAHGPPGLLSVRREVRWSLDRPDVAQSWNGVRFSSYVRCAAVFPGPPEPGCGSAYTITVPAGTQVEGVPGR